MRSSDVLIIGAGVIGLSIARELRKRGAGSITVIDRGSAGREASWAAAGILSPQVEAGRDGEFFRLCYESNRSYPAFAAELLEETGIDVELDRSGVLYVGFNESDDAEFESRSAWQSAAGLNVARLDAREVREIEPFVSDKCTCGLLFPDDSQVENRKVVEALTIFARSNEIDILQGVEAHKVTDRQPGAIDVETSAGPFVAANVVLTAGARTSLIDITGKPIPFQTRPIRGQMICYSGVRGLSRVMYSERGYVVPRADGRVLVGATVEDVGFDRSTTPSGISQLISVGEEIVPFLHEYEVSESWAGLRPFVEGGEPFIGPHSEIEGLYVATGHFRNGILLAPITARMIADRIKRSGRG